MPPHFCAFLSFANLLLFWEKFQLFEALAINEMNDTRCFACPAPACSLPLSAHICPAIWSDNLINASSLDIHLILGTVEYLFSHSSVLQFYIIVINSTASIMNMHFIYIHKIHLIELEFTLKLCHYIEKHSTSIA